MGEAKIALGIPRGFAKTTMMKLFCAYALIHSRHTFILIIGNVGANAEKSIKDVADLLDQPQVRNLYGNLLSAVGKMEYNTIISAFALVVLVALSIFLVPKFGIEGMAISQSVTLFITGLLLMGGFLSYYRKLS